MKRNLLVVVALCLAVGAARADLLAELRAADARADAAIAAIATPAELRAKQDAWRAAWLAGLGGLPEARTPLRPRVTGVVQEDGFRIENIIFESQPGVYVSAHLALPTAKGSRAPHPAVVMPLGHSDNALLNPRYAKQLALLAQAGFAVLTWDPIAQGERRQTQPKFDNKGNCSTEHTQLGARGWLVGWNVARFFLWDAIRAIDYLETRWDVDCSRLGVCGNSGGGTMSTYLQAIEPRIKVAFPNCYVSSLREVFAARGCHDAEQFFFNQLNVGVNHAALLALGQPRVALAVGSRWQDYFPQKGAEATFKVFSEMCGRLGFKGPYWHFHCDGPHGLPPPARAATLDWMRYCIQGGPAPKALSFYQAIGGTGGKAGDDPVQKVPYPLKGDALFCTPSHQVRDLAGFRSLFTLLAERADELALARKGRGVPDAARLREIVRRRAGIRPLSDLLKQTGGQSLKPFDHPRFGWWYLTGPYGHRRENEAALLASVGRSVVGRDAENLILAAARAKGPVPLKAKGWDCIAAAHAFAAEPQLFSGLELTDPPPSWMEMLRNPDPDGDSFAVTVWGALQEYDWVDLVPHHGL